MSISTNDKAVYVRPIEMAPLRLQAQPYSGALPWGQSWWLDYVYGLHRTSAEIPVEHMPVAVPSRPKVREALAAVADVLDGTQALAAHYRLEAGTWVAEVPPDFAVRVRAYYGAVSDVLATETRDPLEFHDPRRSSLRVALVTDDLERVGYVLVLFPGILFDWISKEVLRRRLLARLSGDDSPVQAEQAPSFAALVDRDSASARSKASLKCVDYWEQILSHLPARPYPIPVTDGSPSECRRVSLNGGSLVADVVSLSRRLRVLPSAVLLAAAGLSLARVMGADRPWFSVGISTRVAPADHEAVGAFVRALPILVRPKMGLEGAAVDVASQLMRATRSADFDPDHFRACLARVERARGFQLPMENRFSFINPHVLRGAPYHASQLSLGILTERRLAVDHYSESCWQLRGYKTDEAHLSITSDTATFPVDLSRTLLLDVQQQVRHAIECGGAGQ